ncbi:MAG: HAMP domain-containing histidine kinase [Bacteroidetes bacterium]|nr:HAMP domain-containing histidine kinase [Bacteroidota bacterium]
MLDIKKDSTPNDVNSAAVAHELRNPLNNISLSCDQLRDELIERQIKDEDLLIYIDIIKRNCLRLNNLVTDLFVADGHVSASDSKTIIYILEESLALASDRIKLKKIKLEKIYHSGDSAFYSNPSQLKMAFLNIIMNALESMEDCNGILKIITSKEDNCFLIRFCDNGSGIKEEEINNLFEPFFSKKKGGLGMGLAITKEVLTRANASIEVQSQYGSGTTFTISFKTSS